MGKPSELRARAFRAVHAEALKRGLDHDALRDLCRARFEVKSMGDLDVGQLLGLYREWTNKGLKWKGKLPPRGEIQSEIVSGKDLDTLALEFAERGWGPETQRSFIRRQLRGRETIRTRADFARVLHGVRAMNRRDACKS